MNEINFWKDFRKFMNTYGKKAMEAYEKGLITLAEAYNIAYEAQIEEIVKEWQEQN